MPKKKRTQIKTIMARSINNVDRAMLQLNELHEMFSKQHPQHAQYLEIMIATLLQVREWQLDFWEKAWGSPGDNYRGYLR